MKFFGKPTDMPVLWDTYPTLRFSRAKRFIDLTTRLSDEGSGLARALANFGRMRGEELGEPFMQIGKAHLEIEEMRKVTKDLLMLWDILFSLL